MIKLIKQCIVSPMFIIVFSLSIIALVIFNITYNDSVTRYSNDYDITYCEDINDYDSLISIYEQKIKELNPKDKYYERSLERFERIILIYNELKINNIDYSKSYDFGYGNCLDRTVYLYKSLNIVTILVIINMLVFIYITFTRDFDNYRYSNIYSYTRYNIVIQKISVSFIMTIISFIILFLINYIYSLSIPIVFENVVIVEDSVHIENINYFIFNNVFMYVLYMIIFSFLLFTSISLFTRKTLNTMLFIALIAIIVMAFSFIRFPFVVYLGWTIKSDFIPYSLNFLTRFSIIIPIITLILGMKYFEYSDL